MKRTRLIAITAIALLGLGACSSDSKSSGGNVTLPGGTLPGGTLPGGGTLPDLTLPADVTLPGDISIPDNILPGDLTEECQAIAMQFGLLMAQAFAPTGEAANFEQVFGDISSKVPEELSADVLVLGEAFNAYGEVMTANNNDFANPQVQAALEALGTPEVEAANERISAYFDATCPEA